MELDKRLVDEALDPRNEPGEELDSCIVCKKCQQAVTRPCFRSSRDGSHMHTCVNPAGIEFTILCFSEAEGVRASGPSTPEWSWFVGYHWQCVVCAACGVHLGWQYIGKSGDLFFGLIADRLSGPGV